MKLKQQIEEILRSYFVDKDKDNHWGTPERVDQLYEAFQKTYLEAIGEDENPTYPGFSPDEVSAQYTQGWYDGKKDSNKRLAKKREAIKEK